MSYILFTNRLRLRRLQIQDKSLVFAYRSDPEISRYQSFHPQSLSEMDSFFSMISQTPDQIDTWYQIGIELRSGTLIGDLGIHTIDTQTIEFGYTIAKEYQHQGFATEALSAILPHWMNTYQKIRAIAIVESPNIPSQRLLMKLGFAQTKTFEEEGQLLFQFEKSYSN